MLMLRFTLQSFQLNLILNLFQIHTTAIKSIYYDEIDHLLEFFHTENDDDLLYVDLQILQSWLVVATSSNIYAVYTFFSHKDGGANVTVTDCMTTISMFVPTKATVKLDNGNTGY